MSAGLAGLAATRNSGQPGPTSSDPFVRVRNAGGNSDYFSQADFNGALDAMAGRSGYGRGDTSVSLNGQPAGANQRDTTTHNFSEGGADLPPSGYQDTPRNAPHAGMDFNGAPGNLPHSAMDFTGDPVGDRIGTRIQQEPDLVDPIPARADSGSPLLFAGSGVGLAPDHLNFGPDGTVNRPHVGMDFVPTAAAPHWLTPASLRAAGGSARYSQPGGASAEAGYAGFIPANNAFYPAGNNSPGQLGGPVTVYGQGEGGRTAGQGVVGAEVQPGESAPAYQTQWGLATPNNFAIGEAIPTSGQDWRYGGTGAGVGAQIGSSGGQPIYQGADGRPTTTRPAGTTGQTQTQGQTQGQSAESRAANAAVQAFQIGSGFANSYLQQGDERGYTGDSPNSRGAAHPGSGRSPTADWYRTHPTIASQRAELGIQR